MGKCPYCNQSIPENELSEHIRIELLDPKWKEQRAQLEMRRAQAQQLVQGADVSASLRNLAAQRTDLFGDESDEAARKQREEEALRARKEREKIIWDGHTNSAQKTADTFQTQFTLDEQIKKMHSQMGLAGETPANAAGPQAGPGIVPSTAPSAAAPSMPNFAHLPPALAASLPKPGGGSAYAGATISAAPTGPTTHEYISAPAAAGPSVHPSRQAQMSGQDAGAPPPPLAGNVHARDEDPSAERPVFKRPKIEKLPYPQMYSEIDWQSLHPDPISLSVQLPSMPDKPEWKLDGSIITVPDLPVSFTFGTVRERIKRVVDADLPISRLRLDYMGKVMNNGATLASVNLDDGDLIVMAVKKK
jgi:splicing factor 3A subunit 1